MLVNRSVRYELQLQGLTVGRGVGFETSFCNGIIGQWWTQEVKPNLTKVYGKCKSLVSKANTAGDVLGQTVQQETKKLEGKPFAVMVHEP